MEKTIVITRFYNAPVEDVWRAWSEPELVKRWWGPDRFTCPIAKIDFREGGVSFVAMRASKELGGKDSFSIWSYKKIVPMESIEFLHNLSDKDGNKTKPTLLGMPEDFPEDIKTVVTFKALGKNKTEMTVTEFADFGQMTKFAKMGLEQSLEKMATIF